MTTPRTKDLWGGNAERFTCPTSILPNATPTSQTRIGPIAELADNTAELADNTEAYRSQLRYWCYSLSNRQGYEILGEIWRCR